MNNFILPSPLGNIVMAFADEGTLMGVDYVSAEAQVINEAEKMGDVDNCVARQLQQYFLGQRQLFNVDYVFSGTDFQCQVWRQIATIPFGETRTYGQLARAIGRPSSSRAVGAACGKNPISIIVPCHRVVGASGKLTGYAGGLWRKQWLLAFEKKLRNGSDLSA